MSMYDYDHLFWSKNEHTPCSLTEAALYFFLLHEANRQRWKMPFCCNTSIICFRLCTSKQNIINARDKLKEKGLIDFTKGKGKGQPALYTLLSSNESTKVTKKLTVQLTDQLTDGCDTPINIYKEEEKENTAHTPTEHSRYDKFNTFIQSECPHIAAMEMQMTEEQFYMALDMFKGDAEKMATALRKMENSKSCTECHRSVFDTLMEWKKKGFFDYSQ